MLAGRGIGPFAGGTLARFWSGKAHEQATSGRAFDIAGEPVAALSTALGQIMAADAFGIASKPPRKVGCIAHRILLRQ